MAEEGTGVLLVPQLLTGDIKGPRKNEVGADKVGGCHGRADCKFDVALSSFRTKPVPAKSGRPGNDRTGPEQNLGDTFDHWQ